MKLIFRPYFKELRSEWLIGIRYDSYSCYYDLWMVIDKVYYDLGNKTIFDFIPNNKRNLRYIRF